MSEHETQRGDGELGICHICGTTFATQEELGRHLMEEHEGAQLADTDARDE